MKPTAAEIENGMSRSSNAATPPVKMAADQDLAELLEHIVGLFGAVDPNNVRFRKVGADKVHLPVVILQILFELAGRLVLEPLPDHFVGYVQLQDERPAESPVGDDLLQEVRVILGGWVAIEQKPFVGSGLLQAPQEKCVERRIRARLYALNVGLLVSRQQRRVVLHQLFTGNDREAVLLSQPFGLCGLA